MADLMPMTPEIETACRRLLNAEGLYVGDTASKWCNHWEWYLRGRGKGGTCDASNQARAERLVRAVLEDAHLLAVPEGWKLVPVEPTDDMLNAYAGQRPADEHVDFAHEDRVDAAQQVYRAMVSAAPPAPSAWRPIAEAPEVPGQIDVRSVCTYRWRPYSEPHDTRIVNHNSASRNGEPFKALIDKRGFLPNPVARFCTQDMKVRRMKWYMHGVLGYERWTNVIGLRADEPRRVARLSQPVRDRWTSIAPLAAAGVTKRIVQVWWEAQPFDLRLPNLNGTTPMGNCDLCFLKGEALIRGIIRVRPDLARWWAEAEAEARPSRGDGARFRNDRPGYAEMLRNAEDQGDLMDLLEMEGSVDCACTD